MTLPKPGDVRRKHACPGFDPAMIAMARGMDARNRLALACIAC
jgi:hypothetical protein